MDSVKELFGTLTRKESQCATCQNQTRAFGVKVCRLDKPEPKDGKTCAFFRKWKA